MTEDDINKIVEGLRTAVDIQVREQVYEQTKSKDQEVSGLHREIKNELKELGATMKAIKITVDSHDTVINEIMDIYKTSSRITKAILWIVLFVPGVAAFVAGINYLTHLNK